MAERSGQRRTPSRPSRGPGRTAATRTTGRTTGRTASRSAAGATARSGSRTTPRTGHPAPGARTGPTRGAADRGRPAGSARAAVGRAAAGVPAQRGRPPRLTSRAVILVVIVAVLAVSYASSLRAYLVQRSQLDGLQADIAASQAAIDDLEQEKERLDDPAYVAQQARERLGMVRPGETPFVVLEDGAPLQVESRLTDPSTIDPATPPPWWEGAWDSMRVAGNPPRRADPLPETLITDPEGAPDTGSGSG